MPACTAKKRQFHMLQKPSCIEYEEEKVFSGLALFLAPVEHEAESPHRGIVPVRTVQIGAIPGDVLDLVIIEIFPKQKLTPLEDGILPGQSYDLSQKLANPCILIRKAPIE